MITKTFEEILASIKARLAEVSELDTSEGSYTDTLIRAVAMEIANDYFDQQALLPIAFVDETSGGYIDKRADEYGLTRKPGTVAVATVTFAGSSGTVVPAGTAVQTMDGLVFTTDETVTVSDGAATAAVTAEDVGITYNVASNAITTLQSSAGVTVTSSTAATGGTDPETDEALLARLYAIWRKPPTSGNAYQYEAWALEVAGIGGAKVWETWNGAGTVKVVILDSDMEPPTTDKVAEVAAHINTLRPVCVDVTVVAASQTTINVAATIQIDSTTTKDAVKTQFQMLLDAYCKDLAFQSQTVVYNRIAYMLLSIPGVTDFTALKVNNGTANITLADNAVPVLGTVTVT